jgi:hypothetical protein
MSSNVSPFEAVNNCGYTVGIARVSDFTSSYSSTDFFEKTIGDTVIKFEIYESVDMYFKTAKMICHDRFASREYMPLTGNEIISIRYKNSIHPDGVPEKILHFFINDIREVKNPKEWDRGSNLLQISLVEAPIHYFLSANSVYKSYSWDGGSKSAYPKRSKSIYDLMNDTINLIPNIRNWYEIDIEQTADTESDKINFFIPNWTPLKTLNYLRKFAVNKDGMPYYVCYIDPPKKFGNKPTLVCKSIYTLMKTKEYHVFSSQFAQHTNRSPQGSTEPVRDINEGQTDKYDITNTIRETRFNYFNRIKSSFGNLSGETFFTFDYINDNKYVGLDYDTFKNNYSGLGQYSLHSMNYGNQWSRFRHHSFNEPKRLLSMKQNEYAYATIQSAISCQLDMTLNELRRPGQIADIVFKSPMKDTNIDRMMSGKWLIWSQVDCLAGIGAAAASYVICVKDGFESLAYNPDLTSMDHLQPPSK